MTELTDQSNAIIRHPAILPSKFPSLGIGATLAAMVSAMGMAIDMAYLAPLTVRQVESRGLVDRAGRNPDW